MKKKGSDAMKLKEKQAWVTLARAGRECAWAWGTIGREIVADYGRKSEEDTYAEANAKTARRWAEEGEAMLAPVGVEPLARAMVEDGESLAWLMATLAARLEEVAEELAAYAAGPLAAEAERKEARVGALGFPGARMRLARIAEEKARGAAAILRELDGVEASPVSPSSSAAWKAWDGELERR